MGDYTSWNNSRKKEADEGSDRASPFNRLPDECILEIFSYSPDPTDRWSCSAVSKKWLILQAHMKSSDFKLRPPTPTCNAGAGAPLVGISPSG
ncbi:hypothetical protein EJ110_NYTH55297 [Nymphaea thermarum]|nr:hypothetical protein EJ110_NYTH55294 [Nymphaea thermarum]KAF3773427.1 hypothetical protein EJ110_NYTH55297 [Nymphaea thermarum]